MKEKAKAWLRESRLLAPSGGGGASSRNLAFAFSFSFTFRIWQCGRGVQWRERESGERGRGGERGQGGEPVRGKRRGNLDLGQGDEIKVLDRSGENLSTLLVWQYK